jgi:hypothetical protein
MLRGLRCSRRFRATLASLLALPALLVIAPPASASILDVLPLFPPKPSPSPSAPEREAERGLPPPPVRVIAGGASKGARYRSLPITRRAGGAPRSLASVELRRVGALRGRRIEVAAELQVSVCLKPAYGFRRPRCVGRRYGYDPRVTARLVLAGRPGATGGKGTVALTGRRGLTCTQSQPDRNHHCVISIGWRQRELPRNRPSCLPRSCRLNLVASAHHRRAGKRQRVLVGGTDSKGEPKSRGKLRVLAAVHRRRHSPTVLSSDSGSLSRLPVSAVGKGPPMRVVRSVRIARPRPGETLLVDGRYMAPLGSISYNARTRTHLIVARGARVASAGKGRRKRAARISIESNFNCTQGPSGHRSPCPITKTGAVRFGKGVKGPVYVNLVAGHGAIGPGADQLWRSGDWIEPGAGSRLRVRRYGR